MPKFKKKPVVIDAIHVTRGVVLGGSYISGEPGKPNSVGTERLVLTADGSSVKEFTGVVETLEGRMFFGIGDYIITGVNGEKYPCKPDIFEKTYEPA